MTKNDIEHLLNKDIPNIFESSYVSNVLGITTTLNESYGVSDKRVIIEEQLLLENWFDSITQVGKDLKGLMVALKEVVTNPEMVKKWINGLKLGIISKGIDTITQFLKKVVQASEKFGLDKVKTLAQQVGTFMEGLEGKLNDFSGWAGAMTLTGIALSIKYVGTKVSKLLSTDISDMDKSFLGGEIMEKLEGIFTNSLGTGIKTVINGFSGIGALVSWAVKAFEGAKFIGTTLEPIVSGFNMNPTQDIYLGRHRNENMNIVKNLLRENLNIESSLLEIKDELDFTGFKMHDTLNGDIWKSEDKIKGPIRKNLLKIADDYWNSLELGFEYKDVTMTGSLSNYNWSQYSDVDLHMIFDINELGENEEMIKALLDTKTRAWNTEHDISIKTFDVELYLQPEDQEHHSTGVYSLLNDEWITKPEAQVVKLDKGTIRKKYKQLVKSVEDIEAKAKAGEHEQVIKDVESIKAKIKKMRQSGLDENGEFSVENIVFKLLRRNDIMERLGDLQTNSYDDSLTIEEK